MLFMFSLANIVYPPRPPPKKKNVASLLHPYRTDAAWMQPDAVVCTGNALEFELYLHCGLWYWIPCVVERKVAATTTTTTSISLFFFFPISLQLKHVHPPATMCTHTISAFSLFLYTTMKKNRHIEACKQTGCLRGDYVKYKLLKKVKGSSSLLVALMYEMQYDSLDGDVLLRSYRQCAAVYICTHCSLAHAHAHAHAHPHYRTPTSPRKSFRPSREDAQSQSFRGYFMPSLTSLSGGCSLALSIVTHCTQCTTGLRLTRLAKNTTSMVQQKREAYGQGIGILQRRHLAVCSPRSPSMIGRWCRRT